MGQLKDKPPEKPAVFLSAGVPDPRAPHFMGEGDPAAISAAVSALLHVTLGRRRLVWGGQPAITPMIWAFAEDMAVDYGAWVKLYQSRLFEDEFPEETKRFKNVEFTDIKGDRNVRDSLTHMREQMLDETEFSAAVFIGGMRGIVDEYELFRTREPAARIVAIASTGGAARAVAEMTGRSFGDHLDYVAAFYAALEVDPNERRYRTPEAQPDDPAARLADPRADLRPR